MKDRPTGDFGEASRFNQADQRDFRETAKETPAMTVYLLRHGESGKDKSNPNRELTDKGKAQVMESTENIVKDVVKESNPNFSQWDDPEAFKQAAHEALKNIEFHLRDSGTTRTQEQVWVEHDYLKEMGLDEDSLYMPESVYKYRGVEPSAKAGPGIAKRLRGVGGVDQNPDFRKKLKDKEYQKRVGATSDMMAWALSPDDQIPEGVEKRSEMETRYNKDMRVVDRAINARMQKYPKRVVGIANSHASIATLAAAQELNLPLDELMNRIGEMPEAQGLKFDFFRGGKEHKAKAFGKDIEKAVQELKRA